MATKAGWKRVETALLEDSQAYKDLEALCEKMGIDKATAVRQILVAWSDAKLGLGFSMPVYPPMMYQVPQQPPTELPAGPAKPEKKKPNAAKAAVESLDLDL